MKEKLNQAKEWIKANKKRSAGIMVVFLLIIGAVGIGIVGVTSVNVSKDVDKVATAEKDTSKKTVKKSSDSKKTSKSDKKEDEKATDEEKKADDAKEENDSVAADEKQTAENNAAAATSNAGASNQTAASNQAASSNSVESGSGSGQTYVPPVEPAQPDSQEHVHQWQQKYKDEKVWVDTSGYVSEPIMRCGICNEDITDNPGAHLEAHALAGEGVGNAYSDTKKVWKESGYWDTQSVPNGYQCSCGATK